MATYAVDLVPWAWVEQTRPGGRIVAPWGRLGHIALTVAADGRSASGWMQGLATFMPSRGTDQGRPWETVRGAAPPDEETPMARDDLASLHTDANLLFALRVTLPDVRVRTEARPTGQRPPGCTTATRPGRPSSARPTDPPSPTRAARAASPPNSTPPGATGNRPARPRCTTSA